MADLVRQNEKRIAAYKEQLTAKDDFIKALEPQPWTLQNSSELSATTNHEAAVKVNCNDLTEIHQWYAKITDMPLTHHQHILCVLRLINGGCIGRQVGGIRFFTFTPKNDLFW